jgi:hypothetical protein
VYIIRKHLFLLFSSLIIGSFLTPRASAEATVESKVLKELKRENIKLEEQMEKLQQRLERLEPPKPITIPDSPFPFEQGVEQNYPTDVVPISEVLKKGKRIDFKVIKSEQRKDQFMKNIGTVHIGVVGGVMYHHEYIMHSIDFLPTMILEYQEN